MIKASTLNFVRQRAQEGAEWFALHDQLKVLASIDLDGEKKKLAKVIDDRAKAEKGLKDAQEVAAHTQMLADQHLAEAARLKREAEGTVADAGKRADTILAEAARTRDARGAEWEQAIERRRKELNDLDRDYGETLAALENKRKEHAELEKQHEELIRKHGTLVGALAAMKSSL